MLHAKFVKPWIFSWNNNRDPEQIDRAQDIGGDLTLNREKVYEIGRVGVLGFNKQTPSFSYSMTQFEYGSMKFWYDLANMETPASGAEHEVDLDDLSTTKFDIAAFLTDDDNTFTGSIFFPKLRVNGFSIDIADPTAIIERKFDFVGEDYKMLDEKYYSFEKATVGSGETDKAVVLNPAPIEYASGKYIFKVLRVRSGVVSELTEAGTVNQWVFAGPATVTVHDCLAGDVIKVFYPSSTAYTTTWANNDVDPDLLKAEYAEIYVKVGTAGRVHRLQSIGIDVKFDRTDYREIGNSEVVQTGVKSKTVTISLDKFAEDFSLEDVLAGDTTYPYIDPRDFAENIQLQVKIFGEKEHTNFKMGFLMNNISPTTLGTSQAQEDYNKRTNALECDNLKISDDESEIALS